MAPRGTDTGDEARPASTVEVFVWPPKPAALDVAVRNEPAGAGSSATAEAPGSFRPGWRSWLRQAETGWLGVSAVSWHAAADESGWVADRPEDYCPRCATSAGPFEADADGCPACRGRRLAWSRTVRLGGYEGVLRDAVLAGKYTAWRRVCQDLGADLGQAVREAMERAGLEPGQALICPVPTSTRRRLARGVDHTAVLAREVAAATAGRPVTALRRRHTPPQTGLSGSARQRNVARAFVAKPGVCKGLAGRVVVLVDDVRTTGATLSAAARTLQRAARVGGGEPATIWCAVVGVTRRPGARDGAGDTGGTSENRQDR